MCARVCLRACQAVFMFSDVELSAFFPIMFFSRLLLGKVAQLILLNSLLVWLVCFACTLSFFFFFFFLVVVVWKGWGLSRLTARPVVCVCVCVCTDESIGNDKQELRAPKRRKIDDVLCTSAVNLGKHDCVVVLICTKVS